MTYSEESKEADRMVALKQELAEGGIWGVKQRIVLCMS